MPSVPERFAVPLLSDIVLRALIKIIMKGGEIGEHPESSIAIRLHNINTRLITKEIQSVVENPPIGANTVTSMLKKIGITIDRRKTGNTTRISITEENVVIIREAIERIWRSQS